MNEFDEIIDINGEITTNSWIEWEHDLIPNAPPIQREIMRLLIFILGHCLVCTSLDGCYFVNNNKPDLPQHEHCDCRIKNISNLLVKSNATSYCNEQKFSKYIFGSAGQSNGKLKFFENLGYSGKDIAELKNEYEKQALAQYLKGNYYLQNLDFFGQRLTIIITLKGQQIKTGWMLKPDGRIENTTPFSGRTKW